MSKTTLTSSINAFFVAGDKYLNAASAMVEQVQAAKLTCWAELRPIALKLCAAHYGIPLVTMKTGPYAGEKGLEGDHKNGQAARQALSRMFKVCFPEEASAKGGNKKVDPVAKIVKEILALDGRVRRSLWKQLRDAGVVIS